MCHELQTLWGVLVRSSTWCVYTDVFSLSKSIFAACWGQTGWRAEATTTFNDQFTRKNLGVSTWVINMIIHVSNISRSESRMTVIVTTFKSKDQESSTVSLLTVWNSGHTPLFVLTYKLLNLLTQAGPITDWGLFLQALRTLKGNPDLKGPLLH